MPKRWQKVHDCNRPAKWREALDEEDCKVWRVFGDEGLQGQVSTSNSSATPSSRMVNVGGSKIKYSDMIPQLYTKDDLLTACAKNSMSGVKKLVVVKYYSKKCRMCLRIAAKYRRLAQDYKDDIDCYEACDSDARDLMDKLGVTTVPSVQIFDGDRCTLLAGYVCKPNEWKKLDAKVRVAMQSFKKRRTLHKLFGEELIDELQEPYSYFT